MKPINGLIISLLLSVASTCNKSNTKTFSNNTALEFVFVDTQTATESSFQTTTSSKVSNVTVAFEDIDFSRIIRFRVIEVLLKDGSISRDFGGWYRHNSSFLCQRQGPYFESTTPDCNQKLVMYDDFSCLKNISTCDHTYKHMESFRVSYVQLAGNADFFQAGILDTFYIINDSENPWCQENVVPDAECPKDGHAVGVAGRLPSLDILKITKG